MVGKLVMRCIALLAGAVIAATSANAQTDTRAARALERVPDWRRSVVLITIRCPDKPPQQGSGVLISDTGLVLSAAHVGVDCLSVTNARMGAVRSPYSSPGEELNATLVARRANGADQPNANTIKFAISEDLALWRITNLEGSGLVPARFSQRFQAPGEEAMIVGFSGLPFSYFGNPHAQQSALTINRVWLTSVAARPNETPYRLHYNGSTLEGVSGGPVFDAEGSLIGIHSGRVTTNIRDLVATGCTVDSFGNCVSIGNSQTLGVNFLSVKSVLENYAWATSIHAVPAAWLSQ
jgi:S1-C subfamily serine protease